MVKQPDQYSLSEKTQVKMMCGGAAPRPSVGASQKGSRIPPRPSGLGGARGSCKVSHQSNAMICGDGWWLTDNSEVLSRACCGIQARLTMLRKLKGLTKAHFLHA